MKSQNTELGLNVLAVQMVAVRAQVLAEGGFFHDRELHQCPACGLMEDVLISGKLVTYWRQSTRPVDTGLPLLRVCVVCRRWLMSLPIALLGFVGVCRHSVATISGALTKTA